MENSIPDELKPPYFSFQTFWSFLTALASKPLPPQIDRSMMDGKSGTDQASLLAAMKFFGLIDQDQRVQHGLQEMAAATEDARKRAFASLLRQKYPRQFEISEQNGTEKLLSDSFEDVWSYTGDTRRKAMTFFLHGSRFVGLDLSAHFPVTRMGSGRTPASKPKGATKRASGRPPRGGSGSPSTPAKNDPGIDISLGDFGSIHIDVAVRWLDMPDDDVDTLRKAIADLRGLGVQRDDYEIVDTEED